MANLDKAYQDFLTDLKARISSSRYSAARAVNAELILLYWDIGNSILEKQSHLEWGAKVIEHLAHDLKTSFPDMKGFSERNLKYMRLFANKWRDKQIVQQLAAQLPWAHNLVLLDKFHSDSDRLWYARKALENGWPRNVLIIQIESNLKGRIGSDNTTHNFEGTLTKTQSDLANNTFKDPYKKV